MTYLQHRDHKDREELAFKIRALVHRSYKRAADRQWMRDLGFDVPEPEPGSHEAFEDHVYRTFRRADERTNLRVLPGLGQAREPDQPARLLPAQPPSALTDLDGGGRL